MQVCEDYDKPRKLQRIMEKIVDKEGSKIIIFTETKKNADMLTRNMRQDGYRAGPVYVCISSVICIGSCVKGSHVCSSFVSGSCVYAHMYKAHVYMLICTRLTCICSYEQGGRP